MVEEKGLELLVDCDVNSHPLIVIDLQKSLISFTFRVSILLLFTSQYHLS